MGEALGRSWALRPPALMRVPPLLAYVPGWSQHLSTSLTPSWAETGLTYLCIPVTAQEAAAVWGVVIWKGGTEFTKNGEIEAGATLNGK